MAAPPRNRWRRPGLRHDHLRVWKYCDRLNDTRRGVAGDLNALSERIENEVAGFIPRACLSNHAARYLSASRKISRQLNKGESLHALSRDLHYAQQGTVVRPQRQRGT
ncbi:hypothetical protein AB0C21_41350 [Spirillospora sp. NPDC049024]